jgi:hypothetical protein
VRGAAAHFGLDYLLDNDLERADEFDADMDGASGGPVMALSAKVPKKPSLPTWTGPVRGLEKVSRKAYNKAVAEYRAKKWQLWHEEVKNNPSAYAKNAKDSIRAKRNPRSNTGQRMVIDHKKPLARGGHPTATDNLRFIPDKHHRLVHGKRRY